MFFTVDKCPSGCKIVLGLLGMVVPDLAIRLRTLLDQDLRFSFLYIQHLTHNHSKKKKKWTHAVGLRKDKAV